MRRTTLLLTFGLLMVLLAACGSPAPTPQLGPQLPISVTNAVPSAAAPTATPFTTSDSPTATTAASESPTATAAVLEPTQNKEGLHATDPASVNLASGKPQLVEFFAFW